MKFDSHTWRGTNEHTSNRHCWEQDGSEKLRYELSYFRGLPTGQNISLKGFLLPLWFQPVWQFYHLIWTWRCLLYFCGNNGWRLHFSPSITKNIPIVGHDNVRSTMDFRVKGQSKCSWLLHHVRIIVLRTEYGMSWAILNFQVAGLNSKETFANFHSVVR